ncbi:MAG: sugar ABC transporter ATP-binding protein [Spirochaetes bacterium]|nr:sugar ABC transporter ATP-binding protein [Spirochaetota bacterium]
MDDSILDIAHVTKVFPGVVALDDVTLQIKRGEIHGLCGENGAGKSTLVKILAGVYPFGTYQGNIRFNGRELRLEQRSIRAAIEAGIAIVYQELTLIPKMTVGENIFLGKEPTELRRINRQKLYAQTQAILTRYRLDISPRAIVRDLGVGKQQMAEIAKALSEDAKLLILDEPTSALTQTEVEKLHEILRALKGHGVTCIYISHKLEEFFKIADRITVLRDGKLISTMETAQVSTEKLVRLMVGREITDRFPPSTRTPGEVTLSVRDLHAEDPKIPGREVLKGVSFDLRRGEILGIAGLMGSGRTELVTTIFGEYGRITAGTITLDGRAFAAASAREAMNAGFGLVPEDRKSLGLILIQSVLKNVSLPNLNRFASFLRISKQAELQETERYAKSLAIKAPSMHVEVNSLSGGNQQKVVISKWLMSNPRMLMLDDPTRGIDVGAKFEIYKLMNQLAEQGIAIIMTSSELEEVIGMSDRVVVMCEGRTSGVLERAEATQERVMTLATGLASS